MRELDPGHIYELRHLDGSGVEILTYVKREGDRYPGNIGHHEGTNIQEVCRAQISRLKYLNTQEPHEANEQAINALRLVILVLEDRAADRHGRHRVDFNALDIELYPTCYLCGHIGCQGQCHIHD